MKRLDRYLARAVLWSTLLVMVTLMILSSLFVFISEQREVGTGTYTTLDALIYTALDAPTEAGQFLPLGALIGALLGLGQLARGSELIVLRAAGVSTLRIGVATAVAGLALCAFFWVNGEYLAPPLEHYAHSFKTFAKTAGVSFADSGGNWVKEGNRIVSIEEQSAENIFGGIYLYRIGTATDGTQRLDSVAHADSATLIRDRKWRVDNYVETAFSEDHASVRRLAHLEVTSDVNPQFLGLAVVDPDGLPVVRLVQYIGHLRANGLEARPYEVALWSRIARGLAVILVCVLAVPFVLGPLRSSGAGARMMLGIGIGVGYFLLSRMLENSGQVYNLAPALVGFGPTLLLALVTAIALARVR